MKRSVVAAERHGAESAQPKIPNVAFRKKILEGRVFRDQDLFTECENLVFRRRLVDIHTAPVISFFPFYLCLRREGSITSTAVYTTVLVLVQ
jgi:hypothetical protein